MAAITTRGPGIAARTRAPALRRSGRSTDVIQQRDRRTDDAVRRSKRVVADHAAAVECLRGSVGLLAESLSALGKVRKQEPPDGGDLLG